MKKYQFLTVFALLFVAGCSTSSEYKTQNIAAQQPVEQRYTAYNIWLLPKRQAHNFRVINYKLPNMPILPAGTAIREVSLNAQGASPGSMPSIKFITNDERVFNVAFTSGFHPGKSLKDYEAMMFSTSPFEEIIEGMSETEVTSIRSGVIKAGMSKQAVIASYGYPPEHRTPSLEDNQWMYWMSKYRTKKICFDAQELTIRCGVPSSDPDVL